MSKRKKHVKQNFILKDPITILALFVFFSCSLIAVLYLNKSVELFGMGLFSSCFILFSTLTFIFVVLSLLSILLLRPILLRTKETKEQQTGMEGKYIGKIVKVIEPVDRFHGAITVYDERWDARSDCDEPIPAGAEVRIVKYDSLVLTVEKI